MSVYVDCLSPMELEDEGQIQAWVKYTSTLGQNRILFQPPGNWRAWSGVCFLDSETLRPFFEENSVGTNLKEKSSNVCSKSVKDRPAPQQAEARCKELRGWGRSNQTRRLESLALTVRPRTAAEGSSRRDFENLKRVEKSRDKPREGVWIWTFFFFSEFVSFCFWQVAGKSLSEEELSELLKRYVDPLFWSFWAHLLHVSVWHQVPNLAARLLCCQQLLHRSCGPFSGRGVGTGRENRCRLKNWKNIHSKKHEMRWHVTW